MTNEQKSEQLGIKHTSSITTNGLKTYHIGCYFACLEMAEWKDEQLKQTLMRFFKYLDKRGFLDKDLQCDTEHQVETFLSQFNNQNN